MARANPGTELAAAKVSDFALRVSRATLNPGYKS
jgi:hypothetical protein